MSLLLRGRRKITTDYSSADMQELALVADLINNSMITHLMNKSEIDYLVEYKNGIQPILNKEKVVRDDINNTFVFNHAQMITRNIIGYFLGTPIQYIQNGEASKTEQINYLNRVVSYEDKSSVDKEIGEFQSIVGTAYRVIYTDGIFADEIPFEDRALNPATTYVVYENSIAEKPVLGVTYFNIQTPSGEVTGRRIYAYTDRGVWEIETGSDGAVTTESVASFSEYNVGGIPIIEYPNNMWRLGDWELCMGLMDAINNLNNGRLDDIDQVVQSLLVFINADIDATVYKEMREQGVVMVNNKTGIATDVKSVENSLDQSGMNMFSQELESMLYALIGIPDRNNRSGGGGDTGQAVELRDGWADLEIIARNKELVYKKAEKQTLRIILNIMKNTMGFDLSLMDVDIKFSRNKSNNLLVKTQSYQTLIATKTLDPADCLTIVDLVSDVNEYIARGKSFWGSAFAGVEQAQIAVDSSKVALETAKNPPKEPTVPVKEPKAKQPKEGNK